MFSNSISLLTNIFCSKDVLLYPDYVTLYKQVDITVQYWDYQLWRQDILLNLKTVNDVLFESMYYLEIILNKGAEYNTSFQLFQLIF